MTDTSNFQEKKTTTAEICTLPIPKEDGKTTQLARRYARIFSTTLKEKQYVVLCNVSVPLAQAISLGAWMAGHPVAYINPAFPVIQLNDVLFQLGASLNIGVPDCLSTLENKNDWLSPDLDGKGENYLFDKLQPVTTENTIVPYEWRDDECAAVIFTSGSTGKPKGVCHSIGNLTRSAELFIQRFGIDSDDIVLNMAPLHTVSGVRVAIFVKLLTGCQLIEGSREYDMGETLGLFQDVRPTVCVYGPIFYRQIAMLADKLDDELSSIRVLLSTGAQLDRPSRVRIFEKLRIPVLDYYGLTETSGMIISEKKDDYHPECASIGKECSGVTVDLTEVEGISNPELTLGQIRVYSPNIFLGYLGESMERKRYFDTGDLGERDEAGNIILKGRLDHGVKASSTLWLFPQAVEQILVSRLDISDVHVRSGYDKYDRGVLNAKVVPTNPETVDDNWLVILGQDIENHLGPDYKAVDIEIANEIHRSPLGKIIKDSD